MIGRDFRSIKEGAVRALSGGDPIEAAKLLGEAGPGAISEPDYWRLAARVALATGRKDDIATLTSDLVAKGPQDPRLLIEFGQLNLRLGEFERALTAAAACEAIAEKQDGLIQDLLGTLLVHAGEVERGADHLRLSVASAPASAKSWYNLAAAERMLGRLDAAEMALRRALGLHPGHGGAMYMLSGLRQWTSAANNVGDIKQALTKTQTSGQVPLWFALAKELEDLRDYDASFHALSNGCQIRRSMVKYEVEGDIQAIQEIRRTFDRDRVIADDQSDSSFRGVFVVGLPRTGTTLLERMLGNHRSLVGIGESQAFPAAAIDAVNLLAGRSVSKTEFASFSLRASTRGIAQSYRARVPYGGTAVTVDKLPLNYLYAGLIRRVFPNAHIVLVERHPMDACYAIYKTLFEDAYPFSYSLEDLGKYYLAYRQLVHHWKTVLPTGFSHVSYENLVADPRATLEELLRDMGLEWDESCLRFHKNESAVTTASAVQVREPVHLRSVGRWRHYRGHLAPLETMLNERGVVTL